MPGKKSGYLSHGERVCCLSTNHISILQSIKPGLEAEEIISMINDFLNEMNSLQHISGEGSVRKLHQTIYLISIIEYVKKP